MKSKTTLAILSFVFISAAVFSQGIHYQAVIRDDAGALLANHDVTVQFILSSENSVEFSESHTTQSDGYGQINLTIGTIDPEGFQQLAWGQTDYVLQVNVDVGSGLTTVSEGPLLTLPSSSVSQDLNLNDLLDVTDTAKNEFDWLIWDGSEWVAGQYFEYQELSINGNELSLSDGNTVTLPTMGGGVTYSAGEGIVISNNIISNSGDVDPDDDVTTTSVADGDIGGTFSNLQIKPGTITSDDLADGSIQTEDLAPGTIPPSLPPSGSAGGDLGGSFPAPTVTKLQGRDVSDGTPGNGQVIKWNGSSWAPADDETGGGGGDITAVTAGTGLSGGGTSGAVTLNAQNGTALWNANRLQGKDLTISSLAAGQVLSYDGNKWVNGSAPDDGDWDLNGGILSTGFEVQAGEISGSSIHATGQLTTDGSIASMGPAHLGQSGGIVLTATGQEALWFNGTYFSWGFGANHNFFARPVGIGKQATDPSYILDIAGVGRADQDLWALNSDQRIKENIKPVEGAIAVIKKFNPVTFDWKESYKKSRTSLKDHNYGLIAQEVEEIMPEMVTRITENIDGKVIDDFRVLNKSPLITLLLKAVQEQQEIIDEQSLLISKLQKRMDRMESMQNQKP